jgi:geranylgeranyl reductase family protein
MCCAQVRTPAVHARDGDAVRGYDVAIIGAGPAGATVARELAIAGVHTVLLERARLPRYKSCAGGIPLRTVAALPIPIDSVVEDRVSSLDVTYRGRQGFVKSSAGPFACMVMRDRFDQLLAEDAAENGAELIDGTAVRQIANTDRGFSIAYQGGRLSASLVVGADGANSLVARSTGLGTGLSQGCALEAEVWAPRIALERWRGRVNVDLGYSPSGYGWVFPKERLLSIGVVLPAVSANRLRGALTTYLDQLGLRDAGIERTIGHKVQFRHGAERVAGSGALLIGDAAGLVDEFTEEGIYYAIRSGQIAARFLQRALASGNPWLGAYERALDRELMPELNAARTIARLFYGSLNRAPRMMMKMSAHLDYLWDAFFRVQRGQSTYRAEVRRARVVEPLAALLLR